MRKAVVSLVAALLLGGAGSAAAQNTAEGRAFGATLDLLGETIIDQSDTGTRTAPNPANTPNPATINVTASGATIPAAPLAEVITGPSTTRGCSTPNGCPTLFSTPGPTPLSGNLSNEVFVQSDAGEATASVLIDVAPGGENLLDAVTSGSSVTVRCNNDQLGTVVPQFSATSRVDALVIAGNVVPIPGELQPNTSILAAQFPLLTLNEQMCFLTPNAITPTGVECTVNALHAQIVPITGLGLVDLKLSGSRGKITFDSTCVCNGAMLQLQKFPHVLTPTGEEIPPIPNPGDRIRYVLRVTNSGCVSASGIQIIDRLPNGVTLDQGSLPPGSTVNPCSPPPITGCPGNTSSDDCLTLGVGTLNAGETRDITFDVTVDDDAGCNDDGVGFPICNVARAQTQNGATTSTAASGIILCPEGQPTPTGTQTPGGGNNTPTPRPTGTLTPFPIGTSTPGLGGGDFLVTSGSGGCSLNPHSSAVGSEAFPVLLLGLLLVIRRSRRRLGD